jgi:hypothetical protein
MRLFAVNFRIAHKCPHIFMYISVHNMLVCANRFNLLCSLHLVAHHLNGRSTFHFPFFRFYMSITLPSSETTTQASSWFPEYVLFRFSHSCMAPSISVSLWMHLPVLIYFFLIFFCRYQSRCNFSCRCRYRFIQSGGKRRNDKSVMILMKNKGYERIVTRERRKLTFDSTAYLPTVLWYRMFLCSPTATLWPTMFARSTKSRMCIHLKPKPRIGNRVIGRSSACPLLYNIVRK